MVCQPEDLSCDRFHSSGDRKHCAAPSGRKNFGAVKTKLMEVLHFFDRNPNDTQAVWRRVHLVAAAMGILGAMIAATRLALLLPATIAKTCAIFAVYLIGKAAINAKQLIRVFTAQPNEFPMTRVSESGSMWQKPWR